MRAKDYIQIGLLGLGLSSAGCKNQSLIEECSKNAPSREEIIALTGSEISCSNIEETESRAHCNQLSTTIREQAVAVCLTTETKLKYTCNESNQDVFDCNWTGAK